MEGVREAVRPGFDAALGEIERGVVRLFDLVATGVLSATEALLTGDRLSAGEVIDHEPLVDALYERVEDLVVEQFARQAPVAGDLRLLVSVLRIVPELERSGDLVEHIARRAGRDLVAGSPPRVRALTDQMGRVAADMWEAAARAYVARDAGAAARLGAYDDELDDLYAGVLSELSSGVVPVPVALEMAHVARLYERLGDHAVNVAARVRFLVLGVR
jgi:phosphate transport system protein